MKIKKYKCPVCSNLNTKQELSAFNFHGNKEISTSQEYDYFRCRKCFALFLVGVNVDEAFFKKNYGKNYYKKGNDLKSYLESVYSKFSMYKKRNLVEKYVRKLNTKPQYKILDIGSGDGRFLNSFDKNKYELYGVEKGRKLKIDGVTLFNQDIFSFKPEMKFDIITLWHVVEHIDKPHDLFKKIASLLNKNAYVFISTPNTDSQGFKLAKDRWFHLDSPRHLVLYNSKALRRLADEHSFKVIKDFSERSEYPLDLLWSVSNTDKKWLSYLLYPFFKYNSQETKTFVLQKK